MNKKILFLILMVLSVFLSCEADLLDSYDDSKVYNLRDRGPAGGWIFYINPNYKEDGWRYLEAAPAQWYGTTDDPSSPWTSAGYHSTDCPGTSMAIGTGMTNTLIILQQNGDTACAAKLCRDYRGGGYDDWFLPSMDELCMMCWNLYGTKYSSGVITNPDVPSGNVGGFYTGISDSYCSSSQYSPDGAYYCYLPSPLPGGNGLKSGTGLIRPIRAF